MKNINNIFYIGLLALCTISLATCSDEEAYDFPGDPYNRVYIPYKSITYKIVQTPVGAISNLNFETILRCTQRASENINATVEVDNSMIDAYNEEHGTNYEPISASALIIENSSMNIQIGELASKDTLRIKITDDESITSGLTSTNGYLIPLRLKTVNGGNSQLSSNLFYSYLSVNVTEDNINHDAVESDITGTLVADQTGWSATTNGTVSTRYQPLSTLFDNNGSTYSSISNSSDDLILDINMGKPYTFDAITLWYGSSSGRLYNGMTIYTSDNGNTWRQIGTKSGSTSRFCTFYAPITTQYIRIVRPRTTSSLTCGAFNVYEK